MGNNKEIDLLPDETLASKLIKKGFWLYFFTILIAPTGYIIRVIVSNTLSVTNVGLLYGVIGFISLLSVYNDFGLTESLSYFIPKFWIKKQYDYIKTVITISLGIQIFTGILLALFLFFGADWLAIHYFHNLDVINILKYFSIYFLFINVFQVIQGVLRAFQDVFNGKLLELVRMGTTTILSVVFLLGGIGSLGYYSLGWIGGVLLSVFIGIIIISYKYKSLFTLGKLDFDKGLIKDYRKYALMVFIGANAGIILGQTDLQMIIYFIGGDSVGYYTNYLSLLGIYSIILGPILSLLFPIVTEIINKKQFDKLSMLYGLFYKYLSVFALSIGMLLFVLGPNIASVLFGQKFIYSGSLLHYSVLFIIFNILYTINFTVLAGAGNVKERVKIVGIVAVINVVLNFFLIQYIGLLGAIISTVFGWVLMFIMSHRALSRNIKIRFNFDWKFFIKNVVYICFFGFIIYYIGIGFLKIGDVYRLHNLGLIVLIILIFSGYIMGLNYKSIVYLKREIKKLRI